MEPLRRSLLFEILPSYSPVFNPIEESYRAKVQPL
jgi:transposase